MLGVLYLYFYYLNILLLTEVLECLAILLNIECLVNFPGVYSLQLSCAEPAVCCL